MDSDDERRIFVYRDGTTLEDGSPRRVAGDPLAIYRRLMKQLGNADLSTIDRVVRGLFAPGDDAARDGAAATPPDMGEVNGVLDVLVPAIGAAFGVAPLRADGQGLTEAEMIALLDQFLGFQAGVKKNTATPPSSPPPTDSTRPLGRIAASATRRTMATG